MFGDQVIGKAAFLDAIDVRFALDLFDRGGPVIVLLFALSIITLTVALMKFWQFTRLGVGRGDKADTALTMWIGGRRDEAYTTIRGEDNPCALVLAHGMRGIAAGADEQIIRDDVERVALAELSKLRSYMRVIEATVQLAPLLGLFGTVIGMISSFQALQTLQKAGAGPDPAVLAGGIWVALLTTAVGLAIAIPAAFVSYWLDGRIEREKEHMEGALTSLFTQRVTEAERPVLKDISDKEMTHAAE